MNIKTEKFNLIEWIMGLTDQNRIEQLKFLKEHPAIASEWLDGIGEAEKQSIERGLNSSLKGKTTRKVTGRKKKQLMA